MPTKPRQKISFFNIDQGFGFIRRTSDQEARGPLTDDQRVQYGQDEYFAKISTAYPGEKTPVVETPGTRRSKSAF